MRVVSVARSSSAGKVSREDNRGWMSPLGVFAYSVINTVLPGAVFLALPGRRIMGAVIFLSALLLTGVAGLFGSRFVLNSHNITTAAIITIACGVLVSSVFLTSFLVFRKENASESWVRHLVSSVSIVLSLALFGAPLFVGTTLLNAASALESSLGSLPTQSHNSAPVVTHDGADWENMDEQLNVLIIGSDEGKGRTGVRPDVIMVASINPAHRSVHVFNIPRNLQYAQFSPGSPGADAFPDGFDYGERMINWVWTWAEESDAYKDSENPGLDATRDAVSGVVGLHVDKTMIVNMKGFERVIDSLGGVTVDVPRDLPKAKEGVTPKSWVKKGKDQHLDGEDALWFVRSRAGSSDYDRMKRARVMLGALLQKSASVEGAMKSQSALREIGKSVQTDINSDEFDEWVELSQRVKDSPVEGVALTDEVINTSRPDFDFIHTLVQDSIEGSAEIPDQSPSPEG